MAFPWENSWRSRGNTSSFLLFLLFLRLFCSPLSSPIRFCLFFLPRSGSYTSPRQSSRKTHSRAQTHTHTNKFPCEGGMRLKTYCTLVWDVGVGVGGGLIKQLQCWNLKCCIYTRACDHTSMWEKKKYFLTLAPASPLLTATLTALYLAICKCSSKEGSLWIWTQDKTWSPHQPWINTLLSSMPFLGILGPAAPMSW